MVLRVFVIPEFVVNNNMETTGQGFMRCLKAFEFHIMFSYSEDHKMCMCCVDASGNDVIGYQWMTYVPR